MLITVHWSEREFCIELKCSAAIMLYIYRKDPVKAAVFPPLIAINVRNVIIMTLSFDQLIHKLIQQPYWSILASVWR